MDAIFFLTLGSVALHIIAALLVGVLAWERNYWRDEAEACQTLRIQQADQIRSLKADVHDAQQEVLEWERRTAELQFGGGCCQRQRANDVA